MRRKNDNPWIYVIFGLLGGIALLLFMNMIIGTNNAPQTARIVAQPAASYASKTIGTTNAGDVEITLTPHDPENGQLAVDFAANTHSVDLSQFDLKTITTLTYNGKTSKPLQAPAMRGHHVSGTLIFPLKEEIKQFTITIQGIPKKEERVFSWP